MDNASGHSTEYEAWLNCHDELIMSDYIIQEFNHMAWATSHASACYKPLIMSGIKKFLGIINLVHVIYQLTSLCPVINFTNVNLIKNITMITMYK